MVVGMGRHGAGEPCGRGNNSGSFHSFRSSFFQVCQLRICMMYVLAVVRYVLTSAREKSGAVVGKMKDKEQSSKGSVDNLKTLKNRRKRRHAGMCRHQVGPRNKPGMVESMDTKEALGRLARSLVA
jgi:hypothetical protein